MKRSMVLLMAVSVLGEAPAGWGAVVTYVNIPSVADAPGVPGFPGAIPVQSVTVMKNGYSMVKQVDASSPGLLQAVGAGTHLGTTSVLLYKGAVSSTPDVAWTFKDTLVSSLAFQGVDMLTEKVTFSTSQPTSIYLNLPGVTGGDSRIDHAGIIPIVSLTMDQGTGNTFSVSRLVDMSSPAIQADIANGTVLPTATLLLYDSDSPTARDYAELTFTGVLINGDQPQSGGDQPMENVSFSFQGMSIEYTPVPEPAMGLAMLGTAMVLAVRRGKRERAR